ncbi:hypothetical protein HG535_0B06840 [Zygotorulaspora mrakii]|uniref:Vacuolar protein-sorting-associated protein 36 n=1 Tax=Zygotorulaspora mrakii TaxID=42260 RepID=A0A7H9AZ00_ZYGMR|nr:uncharacterized protein HG535_0B06840 [Zygotorulaspora mrakii]QLG71638.1 hypothetical protein HG535_0B06840 [Zygotorulaspora mrakii]
MYYFLSSSESFFGIACIVRRKVGKGSNIPLVKLKVLSRICSLLTSSFSFYGKMDCWHFIETTSSGQPILRENEKDILIDQMVGLYHNKSKILDRQKGRIFLTSQRIIYVDNLKPTKNSVYVELDDIESLQYSSRFLKRSARLILFLKTADARDLGYNHKKDEDKGITSWVCPICMVTNESEGSITADTKEPPICLNCGVPADYELIKNSISFTGEALEERDPNHSQIPTSTNEQDGNVCPACTFINHPLISNCEICGTRLSNVKIRKKDLKFKDSRVQLELENPVSASTNHSMKFFIQLSFRKSDGLLFAQATEKTLEDLKKANSSHIFNKNLVSINGIDVNNNLPDEMPVLETQLSKIGIASLEKSRETQLLKNDILFNSALTDLNNLMSLVDEIETLFNGHRKKLVGEGKELQKPLLILDREKFYNKSLFLDEIAREIYEFAISEFKESKERVGYVMIPLVDLYAMYNKSMRIGTGLISPEEMKEACERFEQLNLFELKLTRINKRILCIASKDSFEFLKSRIIDLAQTFNGCDLLLLTKKLNEETSSSWTIGILMEILKNCVDEGYLVIDEQISGIYYYKNSFWSIPE